MLSLTKDEGEQVLKALLAYRHHQSRRREFIVDDDLAKRQITEAIAQTDRIIHTLDVRMAAAKEQPNDDS